MHVCAICGNAEGNRSHAVREMMLGTGEQFEYLECGRCGCLQIADPPGDLARYYPQGYYSLQPPPFGQRVKRLLKRLRARRALGWGGGPLGVLLLWRFGAPEFAQWVRRAEVGRGDAIVRS